MSPNQILFSVFGGSALLLFGMRLAGEGMQNLAGSRLRSLLGRLTNNRLMGLASGALVTAALQSSSATTVMLVGMVSVGYLALEQTLGVILGADVGTTLTVQLIAFNVLDYSVLLIGLGAALILATSHRPYHYAGQAILGFGFIFLAMKIIGEAMLTFKDNPLFAELLLNLGGAPLWLILMAAVFTALIHSSAGTIGFALVLANQGLISLPLAIPIVLGANIGTSATALLSSLGTSTEGRRVAVAHVLFKVMGVALVYPFLVPLGELVARTAGDVPRQIANAHTLFNLGMAALFLPFTQVFARLVRRLVPERPAEEPFRPKYLDTQFLESPALAIGQATREALRIADIAQGMLRDSMLVLKNDDLELLEDVRRREVHIDRLVNEIKLFLARLAEHDLSSELSKQEIGLLYVVSDLEHIGDIIDISLMDLARKKIEGRHSFSTDGLAEIEDLHKKVSQNLELAVAAFTARNRELGETVLRHKARINEIERQLRQAHIQRLHLGLRESLDTSAIHMDVLNDLKRINSHATNIAYAAMGEV